MIFLLQAVLSILAILVSTFLLYIWYFRRNHFWVGKPIPSDTPTPVFGITFHALLGKSFRDIDMDLYKKYGRVFGAYNGSQPCIFVGEADLLRSIFVKDFHIFSSRREFIAGNPIIDNMVSALKGDSQWRNIRNTMSPAFSSGRIKNMLPIMSECANLTVNNFEKYSRQNQSVDVKRLYGSYTLDVIANVAFGTQLDSHNDPDNEFVTQAKSLFSKKISIPMLIAFFIPKLAKFFRIEIFPSGTLEFFRNVVNTIVERRLKTKEVRNDFLQIMIDSLQAGEIQNAENLEASEVRNVDATEDGVSGSPMQSVDHIKRKRKDFRLNLNVMYFSSRKMNNQQTFCK